MQNKLTNCLLAIIAACVTFLTFREILKTKPAVTTISKDSHLESAMQAIKQLRRINSIIEMGVSYSDYAQVLVDAKPKVDEALRGVFEGEIKENLNRSIIAYADAVKLWNLFNRMKNQYNEIFVLNEDAKPFSAYNIPWEFTTKEDCVKANDSMLNYVWVAGGKHLQKAETKLKNN